MPSNLIIFALVCRAEFNSAQPLFSYLTSRLNFRVSTNNIRKYNKRKGKGPKETTEMDKTGDDDTPEAEEKDKATPEAEETGEEDL